MVYQILWIREYALFFGVHIHSLGTVLAAFMSGLALGSYVFGRIADKYYNRTVLFFFIIQFALGLFAILFSFFLTGLVDVFVLIARKFELQTAAINLIRPVFGFLLLLFPASLIGGVIPLASKIFIGDSREVGSKLSLIYFINNLGAVFGCLLAGFVLVATFGTQISFYFAACLNFFAGLALLVWHYFIRTKQSLVFPVDLSENKRLIGGQLSENPNDIYSDKVVRVALLVFSIEGFITIAYQVFWTRMLIEFSFEKTIYFTTIVIMSFILGLSFGGLIFYHIEKRVRNLFYFFGLLQVMAAFSTLMLFFIFNKVAPEIISQRQQLSHYTALVLREYGFIVLLLSIPALFTGMTFPLVSKIYTKNLKHIGSRIGITSMLDTLGSIVGSLVATFLLLPWLGVYYAFLLIAGIHLILGMVVFNVNINTRKTWVYNISLPILMLLAIMFFPHSQYTALQDDLYRGDKTIFYKEGVAATVRVNLQPGGHYALVINGAKTAFTNDDDLLVHKMLACLPYVLNPQAESANVIGFGMGVTAATLAGLNLNSIQVADICPELLSAAHIFSPFNNGIINKTGFVFIPEDGRSYLLRTNQTFDIITSNAVHARLNANLYTREFYELCKTRLNPSGVIAQWMPTNWLTASEFKSLVKAFTEVFEDAHLWHVTRGHVIITAGVDPLSIDYRNIENLFRDRHMMQKLASVGLTTPQAFVSNLLMAGDDLRSFAKGPLVNTDNLPIVEFSREIDLKPNATILEAFSNAEFDFKNKIILPDYPEDLQQTFILDVIYAENRLIKQSLEAFVFTYGTPAK